MKEKPLVLIAAGGTGGHLFPAEALANVLVRLGVRVALVSDERVSRFTSGFPAESVHAIASATPSRRSPVQVAAAAAKLALGLLQSLMLVRRLKPAAVVGFGGYPTVPPVLAAVLLRVPSIIHEQNGVMGRANRLLARWVSAVATGFDTVRGIPAGASVSRTGNPVRPAVIEAARTLYPPALKGGKIRVLVFGGSQGAKVMSDVVPAAIEKLPGEFLRRCVVTQQARDEDLLRVRAAYGRILTNVDVQPFFKDLPARMAAAHLVIARSGASTVAELMTIGRPAILVPLPGSLDQDQAANARAMEAVGAALTLPQAEFTPQRLADELIARFENPDALTAAAMAAKSAGIPDAAERLAALVVKAAGIAVSEALPQEKAAP